MSEPFEIVKDEALNKTIRMQKSLIDRLENIAANNKISFNKLVIQCCEYALKHMPDATQNDEG